MALPVFNDILKMLNLTPTKREMSVEEYEVFGSLLKRFITHFLANGQENSTLQKNISGINSFAEFTGAPPWEWTDNDYDRWRLKHFKAGTPRTTLRSYQGSIKKFLDFAMRQSDLCNTIKTVFKGKIKQLVTSHNSIIHPKDRAETKGRRFLTDKEVETFFDGIDKEIERLSEFLPGNHEDIRTLQRNKVMFLTHYSFLLRANETRNLKIDSFAMNHAHKKYGKYGMAFVYGKGHNGSGPIFDTVYNTHDALPGMLEWYIRYVRPFFLESLPEDKAKKQKGLFLAKGGKIMSKGNYMKEFKRMARLSGIEFVVEKSTSHFLRHTGAGNIRRRGMTADGAKEMLRHTNVGTTEQYSGGLKEFSRAQYDVIIDDIF